MSAGRETQWNERGRAKQPRVCRERGGGEAPSTVVHNLVWRDRGSTGVRPQNLQSRTQGTSSPPPLWPRPDIRHYSRVSEILGAPRNYLPGNRWRARLLPGIIETKCATPTVCGRRGPQQGQRPSHSLYSKLSLKVLTAARQRRKRRGRPTPAGNCARCPRLAPHRPPRLSPLAPRTVGSGGEKREQHLPSTARVATSAATRGRTGDHDSRVCAQADAPTCTLTGAVLGPKGPGRVGPREGAAGISSTFTRVHGGAEQVTRLGGRSYQHSLRRRGGHYGGGRRGGGGRRPRRSLGADGAAGLRPALGPRAGEATGAGLGAPEADSAGHPPGGGVGGSALSGKRVCKLKPSGERGGGRDPAVL
ncbi:hypothetical protein J1605_002127 [Eschrichtius robustus]|uniref:Uncharacterized protein n=1 Tax=Eschrichtius robustus TaxID=9764 RepID=A0AB34HZV9_ESCRO|nr:hypothetical protein J1605_002127 [Eschrichtius robustus]